MCEDFITPNTELISAAKKVKKSAEQNLSDFRLVNGTLYWQEAMILLKYMWIWGILAAAIYLFGCGQLTEKIQFNTEQTQEGGYLWDKAEESWEEFYATLETDREGELWKAAAAAMEPYLAPGEFLACDWIDERDDTFPQSGSAILKCTRWTSNGNSLSFKIWITVDENQKNVSSNNYVKELLREYINTQKLSGYNTEVKNPYGASQYIESYDGSLLIGYENQSQLPACMDLFSEACLSLKEFLTVLPMEISQDVKFVQGDSNTNRIYFQDYYPLHTIGFSSVTEQTLQELSIQVQSENLSVMKTLRPKLYEAFQAEKELSWVDYIKPYRVPNFTYCTIYSGLPDSYFSWDYREAHQNSVIEQDHFYEEYRDSLVKNQGEATEITSERYKKYNFLSVDWVETYFHENGFEADMSISNDMFSIRYPSQFLYAYEGSVCMDMIIPDSRKTPNMDMEIPAVRAADRGRFYLLLVQREEGEKELSLEELLKTERVKSRLAPILMEDVRWENAGSLSSDYHEFEYVKGETDLRNTAIYTPHMEKDEEFLYLLVFEEFKDSQISGNLYKMRDQMVRTFIMLPYWYRCEKGDTLGEISRRYTGSFEHVVDLCDNSLNRIADPDRIQEGQYLEIPLNLLLNRRTFE